MGEEGSSDCRLRKCAKKEKQVVDRISHLSNDLLIYILSFLTLEDAAKTTVLSKRWKDLWLFVDRLDFKCAKLWVGIEVIDDELSYSNRSKYVDCVNKVLESHKAMQLELFSIRYDLGKSFTKDVDTWLQYAFARRVKRLDLNLLRYDNRRSRHLSYAFPRDLLGLSNSSPASSSLPRFSCVNAVISGALKSLRALTFRNVNVSGDVVEIFLHSCPFLEHLAVEGSETLQQLEVCGSSLALKHLEITFCFKLRSLIVSDTSIVSLEVTRGDVMVLKNVPMLVNVLIGGICCGNLVEKAISWLSCCLSKLEILTLQIWDLHVRWEIATDVAPQLTKLKQLTFVAAGSGDDSLMVYTTLIRASPNLEKFVLKLQWFGSIGRKQRKSEKALAFPLEHLKVVELCGYYGRHAEVELVEYFVENGVALERITVDPRDQPMFFSCIEKPGEEDIARNLAKEQLPGLVPPHVELVIFQLGEASLHRSPCVYDCAADVVV